MKLLVGMSAILLALSGCSSSGSSSSSGSEDRQDNEEQQVQSQTCVITNDTITVASGSSCDLSAQDAANYNTTAGEVSCSNGTITYGSFTAGGSISLNGLTFACANP
jgi:ABC-type Fe3+-hydroxamate transport system substrate-binding protein